MILCCSALLHPETCRRRKTFCGRPSCSSVQFFHDRCRPAKNRTCGRRGCTAGSSQIMATWVKKHRTAERLASCFGISLIFFPFSLVTILPRVCVNSRGTAVSSRFNSSGTFPLCLAFWHNHWHHLHVKAAYAFGWLFVSPGCCPVSAQNRQPPSARRL